MAFYKPVRTQYGDYGTYHIVASSQPNKVTKQATILVYTYVNQYIRELSKTDGYLIPIKTRTYNVFSDKFDMYFSLDILEDPLLKTNQYKQGYLYLKENEQEFFDAVDLLEDDGNILFIPDIDSTIDIDYENTYDIGEEYLSMLGIEYEES